MAAGFPACSGTVGAVEQEIADLANSFAGRIHDIGAKEDASQPLARRLLHDELHRGRGLRRLRQGLQRQGSGGQRQRTG